MHISDMLDPVFGYDPDTKVGQNPGEETLILHRYRILWSLSVDSRLVIAGKEPMLSKEDRFKEFRSWYRKIPPPQLKSVFEGLWQTSYFTHSELIEMATDTLRVMDRAVDVEGGEVPETRKQGHADAGISLSVVPVSHLFMGRGYGDQNRTLCVGLHP